MNTQTAIRQCLSLFNYSVDNVKHLKKELEFESGQSIVLKTKNASIHRSPTIVPYGDAYGDVKAFYRWVE